jgi:hypothetical protein
MSKKSLNNYEVNSIIKEYQEGVVGIESLATKYKVGKLKIRSILEQNNIPIKSKGAQVTIGNSSEIEQSKIHMYEPSTDGKELRVICKKSGKVYDDVNNLSGVLTKHILDIYGNVPIPTNTYQRKKYELTTGKKWFEEYFDIVEVDRGDNRKCKLCDWETDDVLNRSGCFTNHVKNEHNISIDYYLDKFPEDIKYHSNYTKKIEREDVLSNDDESVMCLECGERFIGLTNSHMLYKHNMSIREYKEKWGNKAMVVSTKTIKLLSDNAIEHNKNMVSTFNSKPQREIEEFISNELNLVVLVNNKKRLGGVEIDLYIPSLDIGIEYNGLYWHSEKMGKTRNYHQLKTILSEGEGVKLIHIFEDEWYSKKEIVKDRLRHILGKTKNKIYGRKCIIREITSDEKKLYLETNHIQGNDSSTIKLGLFYLNELVGVMTFSKPRKSLGYNKLDDNNIYELVRFASNNVIGGADKLLKYFVKLYNPKKIISYADRRWSQGDLYIKLGFNFVGSTKPNYWYTKNYKTREHRFKYRKDVLISKGFDSNKTEFQIMEELGYNRIWDCGSLKYELKL